MVFYMSKSTKDRAEPIGALALRVAADNLPQTFESGVTKCLVAYVCRSPDICGGSCTPRTLRHLVRRCSRVPGSDAAAMAGWLFENSCYSERGPIDDVHLLRLWREAASSGLTDLLDVLDRAGVRRPLVGQSRMWIAAATANSPRVIEWLDQNGCPRHADACAAAASRGGLEALKALRNLSPPFHWTRMTTRAAAERGSVDVFKWALLRGCECDRDTWKLFRGEYGVLAWGLQNGFYELYSSLD